MAEQMVLPGVCSHFWRSYHTAGVRFATVCTLASHWYLWSKGRGDFLSKSLLYCTRQPGLGWPPLLSKKRLAATLHVSQRLHLACAQAKGVEISVFPRVGRKCLAFDKVVKRVFTRQIRTMWQPLKGVALKRSEYRCPRGSSLYLAQGPLGDAHLFLPSRFFLLPPTMACVCRS